MNLSSILVLEILLMWEVPLWDLLTSSLRTRKYPVLKVRVHIQDGSGWAGDRGKRELKVYPEKI